MSPAIEIADADEIEVDATSDDDDEGITVEVGEDDETPAATHLLEMDEVPIEGFDEPLHAEAGATPATFEDEIPTELELDAGLELELDMPAAEPEQVATKPEPTPEPKVEAPKVAAKAETPAPAVKPAAPAKKSSVLDDELDALINSAVPKKSAAETAGRRTTARRLGEAAEKKRV